MIATPIGRLRLIGMIEAVSFLVLVFVAMPIKYLGGVDHAVRWPGLIHGVLFILFCLALLQVKFVHRWSVRQCLVPFAAALVPFGPFVIDRRLREAEQ